MTHLSSLAATKTVWFCILSMRGTVTKTGLNTHREEDRLFIRMIMMWAQEVSLDRQARLMIPKELTEIAAITTQVVIIGALEKIELWSPEYFRAYNERYADTTYEAVAARVMGGV
jgi:MraZ protein